MKKLARVYRTADSHWVGNGFPVRSVFSHNRHGADVSPFLLLDYAGPAEFPPASGRRGVEQHPHRGFETVTIVYQGEVEHRDTAGNEGRIGPGDVQWMTAARGILHEEMHGRAFAEKGGTLEMVQLWVNLPARHKMSAPTPRSRPCRSATTAAARASSPAISRARRVRRAPSRRSTCGTCGWRPAAGRS
jgi:redox-sensitive bicupin YhaK (pirin superfamily)